MRPQDATPTGFTSSEPMEHKPNMTNILYDVE
jgi:hypothetical protein